MIGIVQIVTLGCGMDTRSLRLDLPSTTFYEVDLPHVLQYKNDVLEPVIQMEKKERHRVSVSCDLSLDTWMESLKSHGFAPDQPSAWIMEGLVMYIERSSAIRLIQNAASLMSKSSRMIVHTLSEASVKTSQVPSMNTLASVGAPLLFGIDDPREMFQDMNVSVSSVMTYRDIAPLYDKGVDVAKVSASSYFTIVNSGK
eukprot:TRINITY_DN5929_c0_g1_i1.p1 TRINITY_DN5929_c0_g1~~TRINITY_DN5929_c0_g1_i1.p1  ORF type:complete len:199 (-),score=52.96 TRINITY_DN5929_c0_g1_i1:72-668(-)